MTNDQKANDMSPNDITHKIKTIRFRLAGDRAELQELAEAIQCRYVNTAGDLYHAVDELWAVDETLKTRSTTPLD